MAASAVLVDLLVNVTPSREVNVIAAPVAGTPTTVDLLLLLMALTITSVVGLLLQQATVSASLFREDNVIAVHLASSVMVILSLLSTQVDAEEIEALMSASHFRRVNVIVAMAAVFLTAIHQCLVK